MWGSLLGSLLYVLEFYIWLKFIYFMNKVICFFFGSKLSSNMDSSFFKTGDIIEFANITYSHYAIYIGNEYTIGVGAPNKNGKIKASKIEKKSFKEVAEHYLSYQVNNLESAAGKLNLIPLSPDVIVKTAEDCLGNTHQVYHLLRNNCEHFATFCRYGKPFSRQSATTYSNYDATRHTTPLHRLLCYCTALVHAVLTVQDRLWIWQDVLMEVLNFILFISIFLVYQYLSVDIPLNSNWFTNLWYGSSIISKFQNRLMIGAISSVAVVIISTILERKLFI